MEYSTCGYLIRCDCGNEIRVGSGQAGAAIRCRRCAAEIRLPKLSSLRQLPLVAGLVEARNPWQFSLGALFLFVTFVSLFLLFGNAVGFPWLVLCLSISAAIGILGAILPRPVLYGSVLGGIVLLLGALTVCSIAQSRESARRTQATNNLKELGVGFGQARKYFPTIEPSDSQRWVGAQSQAVEQGGPWRVRKESPLPSESPAQ